MVPVGVMIGLALAVEEPSFALSGVDTVELACPSQQLARSVHGPTTGRGAQGRFLVLESSSESLLVQSSQPGFRHRGWVDQGCAVGGPFTVVQVPPLADQLSAPDVVLWWQPGDAEDDLLALRDLAASHAQRAIGLVVAGTPDAATLRWLHEEVADLPAFRVPEATLAGISRPAVLRLASDTPSVAAPPDWAALDVELSDTPAIETAFTLDVLLESGNPGDEARSRSFVSDACLELAVLALGPDTPAADYARWQAEAVNAGRLHDLAFYDLVVLGSGAELSLELAECVRYAAMPFFAGAVASETAVFQPAYASVGASRDQGLKKLAEASGAEGRRTLVLHNGRGGLEPAELALEGKAPFALRELHLSGSRAARGDFVAEVSGLEAGHSSLIFIY